MGRLFGSYRRFEGLAAARAIMRLYGASRLFVKLLRAVVQTGCQATRRREGGQALSSTVRSCEPEGD